MYTVYVAELTDMVYNDLYDELQAHAKEAVLTDPLARAEWVDEKFEEALEMVAKLQSAGVRLKFQIDPEAGAVDVELCHPE